MPGESQNLPTTGQADPSILTTEQLLREVENATKLLQAELEGFTKVTLEKFESVATQFALFERQRVEQKADTAEAVKAALSAAKEAVAEQTAAFALATAKSEAATTKSIDQLGEKFDTAFDGQRRDSDDLKGRVGSIESRKEGTAAAAGTLIAVLGLLLTVIVIAVAIYAATHG